jgi:hypothetical protein
VNETPLLIATAVGGLLILAIALIIVADKLGKVTRLAEARLADLERLQRERDALQLEVTNLQQTARQRERDTKKLVASLGAQTDGAEVLTMDQARQIQELKAKVSALQKSVPTEKTHQIILDGMSEAGKSTFVARVVSPVIPSAKLKKMVATARQYSTQPLPVCWVRDDKAVTLHTVKFWDIAGERGATFLDALDSIRGNGSGPPPRAVLLIVWDVSDDNVGKNSIHLNPTRIEMAYGSMKAREVISSVVVFFNKSDRVDSERLEQRIETEKRDITRVFQTKLGGGYQNISFFVGSALDGRGMHDCIGSILQSLGLEGGFQTIDGASEAS